uniref:Uncharacterized protein n=1 Tax=Arundo donax TaxID=35708 RepID=A0A0A8Z930_ARUDO
MRTFFGDSGDSIVSLFPCMTDSCLQNQQE